MRIIGENFWKSVLQKISFRGLILLTTMLSLVSGMLMPAMFRSVGRSTIRRRALFSSSHYNMRSGWQLGTREAACRASSEFCGWSVLVERATTGKRGLSKTTLRAAAPLEPSIDPTLHAFAEVNDNDVPMEARGLPKGSNDGFYVVKTYITDKMDFDLTKILSIVEEDDFKRLELTPQNISVPVALMMLDTDDFPSRSRARKACRKGNIMIHRGPLQVDEDTGKEIFDASKCIRARVGDRVHPGGTFVNGLLFSLKRSGFSVLKLLF